MKWAIALVGLIGASLASAQNPDYDSLDKRLKAIEKRTSKGRADVDQRTLHSFLNTQVQLGGFLESAVTSFSQSNRHTQLGVSNTILGLNLSAEFNDDIRLVTQFWNYVQLPLQNPHNDPNAAGAGLARQAEYRTYVFGALLTQGYVQWGISEGFNLQLGQGYAPFGIAIQQLEPVLFVRRGGPQILRTGDLAFPFWQGLSAQGSFSIGKDRWGYSVYTFNHNRGTSIPGLGGRAWWRGSEGNLTFGLSAQHAKREQLSYHTLGLDARLRAGSWTFTHELAKSNGAGPQPWSAYLETDYELDNQAWIPFIFADYLDNPVNRTASLAALPDPLRKWEYGGGVNWLPTSFTRFRFALILGNYVGPDAQPLGQTRDYWSLDLSAGVAF